jgi:hypothetical protein
MVPRSSSQDPAAQKPQRAHGPAKSISLASAKAGVSARVIIAWALRHKLAQILLGIFKYPNRYKMPGLLHPFKSK